MQFWMLAAAANVVIFLAYIVISATIASGLRRSGQSIRDNPLGWATAAIFVTCAVHHGNHPIHMLAPALGADIGLGLAMREAFSEWHVAGWDVLGGGVAVWYLTLRARFPALVRGAAIFEDMRERQRQALEIHDNVVQGLAVAKLSLETGDLEGGLETLDRTLASSRDIITGLLGDAPSEALLAGNLRRGRPAGTAP